MKTNQKIWIAIGIVFLVVLIWYVTRPKQTETKPPTVVGSGPSWGGILGDIIDILNP